MRISLFLDRDLVGRRRRAREYLPSLTLAAAIPHAAQSLATAALFVAVLLAALVRVPVLATRPLFTVTPGERRTVETIPATRLAAVAVPERQPAAPALPEVKFGPRHPRVERTKARHRWWLG
jgi:hypothetical protein